MLKLDLFIQYRNFIVRDYEDYAYILFGRNVSNSPSTKDIEVLKELHSKKKYIMIDFTVCVNIELGWLCEFYEMSLKNKNSVVILGMNATIRRRYGSAKIFVDSQNRKLAYLLNSSSPKVDIIGTGIGYTSLAERDKNQQGKHPPRRWKYPLLKWILLTGLAVGAGVLGAILIILTPFLHPQKNQTQLLLQHWPEYIVAILLLVTAAYLTGRKS